jgi:predicted acetyltransferase
VFAKHNEIILENTEEAIINGQFRDTGNIGYTIRRKHRDTGNIGYTIRKKTQRYWQHRVHNTKTTTEILAT